MSGSLGYPFFCKKRCSHMKIHHKNMPTVTIMPFGEKVYVSPGTLLLDAIKKARLPLKTTCGGRGTCGDCVVQVLKGKLKTKAAGALPERLVKEGYTLACRSEIIGNLIVHLPEFQELSINTVQDPGFLDRNKDRYSALFEIKPGIKRVNLKVPPSTLEDNYSDLSRIDRRIHEKFSVKNLHCKYPALKKLARILRKEDGKITLIIRESDGNWNILDALNTGKANRIYGLACDIGTTTVSVNIVDLEKGLVAGSASSYNQQIKCGEDIISRINYAQKNDHLQELHELIILTVNNLIEKAADPGKISPEKIYTASVNGNTTMIHLFLNLDPRYIREEPYVPTFNRTPVVRSGDVGLKINQEAAVCCGSAVGSYVGSDISSGLLCTPVMRDSRRISFFLDVGTNGELVLGNKDWLMTCACSAGPAFEGGGIMCGMPASGGAIDRIKLNADGEPDYQVIHGGKPKGLCGSGLIDILAELFINGYINRSGHFIQEKSSSRLVEVESGAGFLIENEMNSYWGKDLVITAKDIANLIRTKGAVYSAYTLLMKNAGLKFDQIDAFYIAGGFGRHLNIENSIRIGLLPDLERHKFHYIGNSSLNGAVLTLLSEKNRRLADEISRKMTYIELNTVPSYMNEYTGALFLPHTETELFPSVKKIFN